MPRRAAIRATATVASEDAEHAQALALLRQQWKWAALCQYFHTFAILFAMPNVTVDDIEDDLTRSGAIIIPRIMLRLLVTLTQDRKITLDNWQLALRRQHTRRDPDSNPLAPIPTSRSTSPSPSHSPDEAAEQKLDGCPEDDKPADAPCVSLNGGDPQAISSDGVKSEHNTHEDAPLPDLRPLDWLDLPMLAKLDSIHLVAEWHFQNPGRFRSTVKSDDEDAEWRIEPIGYDAQANAYWLIGENRLWIQRKLPTPPQGRKRKRPNAGASHLRAAKRSNVTARAAPPAAPASRPPARGATRSAKLEAQSKLHKQAKDMARWQAETHGRGTRASARLRGADEEWQQVPEEWLRADAELSESPAGRGARRTRVRRSPTPTPTPASDEESDLTELSELSDDDDAGPAAVVEAASEVEVSEKEPSPEIEEEPPFVLPEGFVEWETICVTLYEWEHIAERFKGATHYAEKALYKLLTTSVIPEATQELQEIERKKRLDEAVTSRKRSSRLAGKEAEKEAERQVALKKQEEEKEFARLKRLEARQQREENTRAERETARERRRLEREAQELEELSRTDKEDILVVDDSPPAPPQGPAQPQVPSGQPLIEVRPARTPKAARHAHKPRAYPSFDASTHASPAGQRPYPVNVGHEGHGMFPPLAHASPRHHMNGSAPQTAYQQSGTHPMPLNEPHMHDGFSHRQVYPPQPEVRHSQYYAGHVHSPGSGPFPAPQVMDHGPPLYHTQMNGQQWQHPAVHALPYAHQLTANARLVNPSMHAAPQYIQPEPGLPPMLYPGYAGGIPGMNGAAPGALQQLHPSYTYPMQP